MAKKITYFTPTYNRKNLLLNLYKSLINQKNKNFIWLIVDDGSTDGTDLVVKKWQSENLIDISYYYTKNSGKNAAMDFANRKCGTEFICCVDSDDYITPEATDVMYYYIDKFSADEEIVGFVGRRANYNKVFFKGGWPKKEEKLFFKELSSKYKYNSDTVLVFKTNIVKKFSFPKYEGENFVTESVLYNQFLYDYKLIVIDECIYLSEYQEDGYTAQGLNLFFKNPKGYLCALKQNAYYAIEKKDLFKHKLYFSAVFYAWKKFNKLKDDIVDYRIKFPYNFLGKILGYTHYFKKFKDSYEAGHKN